MREAGALSLKEPVKDRSTLASVPSPDQHPYLWVVVCQRG
jgi:hypothetical protein